MAGGFMIIACLLLLLFPVVMMTMQLKEMKLVLLLHKEPK
jgi:hypothetical protein